MPVLCHVMLSHLSHVRLCDSMDIARGLLCPWDSPSKNTGVGCHALLQGIFLTQPMQWQASSLPLAHHLFQCYYIKHNTSDSKNTNESITNSQSLPKLMSIKSEMSSNHLILCCPLLLPPSGFPRIRVFSSESVLRIRWPKYWSFSFSISP